VLVEVGPVGALGDAVEVGEQVGLGADFFFAPLARLLEQVVDQHLGVDLLLNVERRRVHHETRPVLLVLAAPDQLRVEVAVAALVGHADGALRFFLLVGESFNGPGVLWSPCHGVRSPFQKRVLDGEALDALAVLQILAVESGAAGIQGGGNDCSR
jgi:hypothetical protein